MRFALTSLAPVAASMVSLGGGGGGGGGGGQEQAPHHHHGRNLVSSTITDGYRYLSSQQHPRGLLDPHPAYYYLLQETVQNSFTEAMQVCDIHLEALSFFETNEQTNTSHLQMDVALLKHYASYFPATCSDSDEQTFRQALSTFQTCSSFDVEGILETFGDAVIGSVMDCVTAMAPLIRAGIWLVR